MLLFDFCALASAAARVRRARACHAL